MMPTDDSNLLFLRDQVKRLNQELHSYHEKYGLLTGDEKDVRQFQPQDWHYNSQLLTPLIQEYDLQLGFLKKQISTQQENFSHLRNEVLNVTTENERLHGELQNALRGQVSMENFHVDDIGQSDDTQQRTALLQEKEAAQEMWRTAMEEVKRLQDQLQRSRQIKKVHVVEEQASQIQAEYYTTVQELNLELESCYEESRIQKSELHAANIQISELRKTLKDLTLYINKERMEKSMTEEEKGKLADAAEKLRIKTEKLLGRVEEEEGEAKTLKEERDSLRAALTELQANILSAEGRGEQVTAQMKDCLRLTEVALFERDQAAVLERRATERVLSLQGALSALVEQAAARTRQEVDDVKLHANGVIHKLNEQVQALELAMDEKSLLVERSRREKETAEKELERQQCESLTCVESESRVRDDLTQRACQAERLRDECGIRLEDALNKLQQLRNESQEVAHRHKRETQQMNEQQEMLRKHASEMEHERELLEKSLDEIRQAKQQAETSRMAAEKSCALGIGKLESQLKLQQSLFDNKLEAMEAVHGKTSSELNRMLRDQQKLSGKWKAECENLAGQRERERRELKAELQRLKQRNQQLGKLLRESHSRLAQSEQLLARLSAEAQRTGTTDDGNHVTVDMSLHAKRAERALQSYNSFIDG